MQAVEVLVQRHALVFESILQILAHDVVLKHLSRHLVNHVAIR